MVERPGEVGCEDAGVEAGEHVHVRLQLQGAAELRLRCEIDCMYVCPFVRSYEKIGENSYELDLTNNENTPLF